MTIQEFSVLLEKGKEVSPLLQALRALRACSQQQIQAEPFQMWIPWANEAQPLLDQP